MGSLDYRKQAHWIDLFGEANIPVAYWNIKMKDFTGPNKLKTKTIDYIKSIKQQYADGKGFCTTGNFGVGKDLDLNTPIITTNGWKTVGDLVIGDEVFGPDGKPTKVTYLSPITNKKTCYQLKFDDDSSIIASDTHDWVTWTYEDRAYLVEGNPSLALPKKRTTVELKNTISRSIDNAHPDQIEEHSIPCTEPIEFAEMDLPLDPYTFGCWMRYKYANVVYITNMGREGIDSFKGKVFAEELKSKRSVFQISNDGGIPSLYKFSSIKQRSELIRGLLNADRSSSSLDKMELEFSSKFRRLSDDLCEMLIGLGYKCIVRKSKETLHDKDLSPSYRVLFTKINDADSVDVKSNLNKRIAYKIRNHFLSKHRYITSIEEVDAVPVRCIMVDNYSHLFLAGKSLISTHNTTACCAILKSSIMKEYSAYYTTLSDMITYLTDFSTKSKFYYLISRVDFLCIDEVDSRHFSDSEDAQRMFGSNFEKIIRYRTQNKLPVIIASNNATIVEVFKGQYKRAVDSLLSNSELVPALGKDIRKNE